MLQLLRKGLLLLPLLLTTWLAGAQTVLQQESFETDGEGSRYVSTTYLPGTATGATGSTNQYFFRASNATLAPASNTGTQPTGGTLDGSFYWTGEGVRGPATPFPGPYARPPGTVTLNSANVAGYRNLQVKVGFQDARFVAGTSQNWEPTDTLKVQVRFNGAGPWVTVGQFTSDQYVSSVAGQLRQDVNLDGKATDDLTAGSPLVTATMTDFTFNLPGTASTLQTRVVASEDGLSEEFAFDNIRVLGTAYVSAAPVLANMESSVQNYPTGGATVAVTSALTVADADNTTQTSAVVRITNGWDPANDVLLFAGTGATGNIAGSFNASAGVLTLTSAGSTATLAQWQAALRLVSFRTTSAITAASGNRTILFATIDPNGVQSNVAFRTVGFSLLNPATVTTAAPASVGATSASLGGNVTADGGAPVTDRGVVYSTTNTTPTTADTKAANGTGTGVFSATITGLTAATTYYVRAYAINSAGTSYGAVQTFTTAAALSATSSQTNVSCFGGTNGTATVTVTGGVAPYTYAWSPSGGTAATATGLAAGAYTVTIADAGGATITRNFTITQPPALVVTAASQTNIACFGGSTGAASVNTPTGGTAPYAYNWTPGNPTGDGTPSVTGLSAGTWTVTVTDANTCQATRTFTITQPASAISLTTGSQTNVACNGGATGAASVSPTGGTPGYTYAWSPSGGTAATATGLVAGTYTVTVTDANNCQATRSFTITQPATALSGSTVVTNVSCNGGSNGTINLTPAGGTGPYTFLWNGGATTEDRTGLAAGTYSVTITDANNCSTTISNINVTQPPAISLATSSQTNVACNGGSTGAASVSPTGGTAPYAYNWTPGNPTGDGTATVTGLTAGTWTVTVTDANNCTATRTFTITQPPVLTATMASQTNIACFGGSTGAASINTPTGGTAPYAYNWTPGNPTGDGTPSVTGLAAGTWTVTVTDANACTTTQTFTITQPASAISLTTGSQTNVACNGGATGAASVSPTGGTPGYTYAWSPSGGTAATATGLAAGTYTVTVTDANNCQATRSFTITQPAVLTATTSQTNVSTNGGNNGSASITVSGGTPAYTYAWTPNVSTTATATGLSAGTYSVTATDANGCTISRSFTITEPSTAAVASVTRLTPSPTATAQVRYQVLFSASVSGVTVSNFSVTATGLSGASVTSVSGSGTTYTVTVNTGTGDGTLRLNVANGTGITPTVANVPFTTGETYTITKSFAAAPQLSIQGTGGAGTDVTAFVDVVQVLSGGSPFANALQNGSFETHDPLGNGSYGYNPTGASWTFNSRSGIAEAGSAFTPITPVPNGVAVGVVQSEGGINGVLQQNLALPTGSNYQVNFQTAQRVCCSSQDQALNVFLNGVFIGNIQPASNSAYSNFTSATFSVTAPALTATVSTTSGSPTSTSPIPFAVSFSQSVGTTFTAADVTVTGGTLTAASFGGSGAGPYTFSVTPGGAGTVTVSLAANVASDANNTGNAASNAVSVQFLAPTITVSPASLAGGTQGTPYSQTLTAAGGSGSYTFAITAGALPGGLTLTPGGTLAGTPTANGTFNFTVTATDNSVAPGPYSGSRSYTLTIAAPAVTDLTISTGSAASPVDVAAGTYNNVTVTGTGFARLNGAVVVNNTFTVQTGGALNTNCQSLTGSGSFTLQAGATLYVCDASGIAGTGSTGAIQLSGTRSFSPGADYVYNGTAAQVTGTGLPSQVRNLTSTNTSTLTLSGAVAIRQVLTLNTGSLNLNGQALTLLSDASGTALVANLGGGSVLGTTVNVQRYIDPTFNPGLGYRHLAAPVFGATVGSFGSGGATLVTNGAYNTATDPGTVTPFPTVYFYDQARLATSPATTLSAFDKGWASPTSLSDAASLALRGFTVQLPGASTLSFSGQVGNGGGSIPLSRNGGATAADAGWNFIGNPYPSPLDFSTIAAGQRTNMDAAFYTFESTSQYGGSYRSYVNGVGTSSLVGSSQAFFVRVTNGFTSGSLTLGNANRVTNYGQQAPVRRPTAETRPLVQLNLASATGSDPVYVYFENGATAGVDGEFDAVKLPNSHGLNVSAETGAQRLAIDGLPALGTATVTVPLTVGVPAAGSYAFQAAQLLNLGTTPVYLRDLQTGAVVDLARQPRYSFVVGNAAALVTGRFELVFSPQAPLATAPAALAAQVGLYPNPATSAAFVELPAALGRVAVAAELVDALGRTVRAQSLPAQGAAAHRIELTGLATGVYTLHLRTSAGMVVKKLVVE